MKQTDNKYCVYVHKDYNGSIMYVGSGTESRANLTCAKSNRGIKYEIYKFSQMITKSSHRCLTNKDNMTKLGKKLRFPPRPNAIVALCVISESEINKVMPNYSAEFENEEVKFKSFLYSLGMDINKPFQRQDGLQHRNRLNEVVVCSRWVGEERLDEAWIYSGYASKAAIDKASGSKLTEDLYRARYETQDAQEMLEARDRYSTITEDE